MFPTVPQVEDPSLRLSFLRNAESLSLFLGLVGDAGLKASRWRDATRALLARPLDPNAVLESISLSPEDKAMFLSRLDSKDLSATVDQRTLVHLLLRAERREAAVDGTGVAATSSIPRLLQVDRIMPQHPPEGSKWRRTKVYQDDGSDAKYW